jgi:uncharacterized protein (TIGR03000 family)
MFKQFLMASLALLIVAGSVHAQRGGGGGGRGGGGYGGGRGYGGGYGGYGYGRGGFYGGYGAFGFYGVGYPYPYPYFGVPYDVGGLGYSSFGGFGSGGSGLNPGSPIIPYSPEYIPGPANIDPTALPSLPAPLTPPGTTVSNATPATATVNVIVPEGGQVWFDDTLTPSTGSKWVYTSPKLEPGKTYTLKIKARWAEGGQDRNYDIPLRIVAGDKTTMDLTKIR